MREAAASPAAARWTRRTQTGVNAIEPSVLFQYTDAENVVLGAMTPL